MVRQLHWHRTVLLKGLRLIDSFTSIQVGWGNLTRGINILVRDEACQISDHDFLIPHVLTHDYFSPIAFWKGFKKNCFIENLNWLQSKEIYDVTPGFLMWHQGMYEIDLSHAAVTTECYPILLEIFVSAHLQGTASPSIFKNNRFSYYFTFLA